MKIIVTLLLIFSSFSHLQAAELKLYTSAETDSTPAKMRVYMDNEYIHDFDTAAVRNQQDPTLHTLYVPYKPFKLKIVFLNDGSLAKGLGSRDLWINRITLDGKNLDLGKSFVSGCKWNKYYQQSKHVQLACKGAFEITVAPGRAPTANPVDQKKAPIKKVTAEKVPVKKTTAKQPSATKKITAKEPILKDMMGNPLLDVSSLPKAKVASDKMLISSNAKHPDKTKDPKGSFRTKCQFSHFNYDDSIVYPGQKNKSHLHVYFGNTESDAFSTNSSIRNKGKSTCDGGIGNRSSYWVPAMLDAQNKPIVPVENYIYYKPTLVYGSYLKKHPYQVMPDGLKMISGNAQASTIGENPNAHYYCDASKNLSPIIEKYKKFYGHGAKGNTAYPYLPHCVGGKLVMVVNFLQCWNGELDSPDHKSHLAKALRGGACPASHPTPLTRITYKVKYDIPDKGKGTKGWHLSSDMYDYSKFPGLSAHGDWREGWDTTVKELWLKNCIRAKKNCGANRIGEGKGLRSILSLLK